MSKIGGYARLIRPVNCLMIGFAVIIGAILANPNKWSSFSQNATLGFTTGFTLTAASMVINDYYDRQIDSINEPNRPIPSGLIKPNNALWFASLLTIIGFVTSYLTNIFCLATALVAWIFFVAYTTVGKRSGLPGNFLVSACVAIPFVYGMAIVAKFQPNVALFASMAFLSNTGREITKGIVDAKGDAKANVKTMAVRFGEKKAAAAAAVFYLSAVLLSPIPWFLNLVSFWFIPPVLVTDIGLAASSIMLVRDPSRENARKIKTTMLLWFIIGLLAFIVGTVK